MLSKYEAYLKIAVILLYTLFIWHCHTIYDNSKLTITETKQITNIEKAESRIIAIQPKLKKLDEKDKCINTTIPVGSLKLLQHPY